MFLVKMIDQRQKMKFLASPLRKRGDIRGANRCHSTSNLSAFFTSSPNLSPTFQPGSADTP